MQKSQTIIIGAGPAGLAVGGCLKQKGLSFEIIDQATEIGSSWRNHYDRLHLHTSRKNSGLPGLKMPRSYPTYPARTQVIDYLERYAQQFSLKPHLGETVIQVTPHKDGFTVTTTKQVWQCENVVVANGLGNTPQIPQFEGMDSFPGRILHSGTYKTGKDFQGEKVLVVGFGNSGGEIAIDLVEQGAKPALAVRSTVNIIPKEVFGLPSTDISILTRKLPYWFVDGNTSRIVRKKYGDFSQFGLEKSPLGPREQVEKTGRIPLIDIGTMDLIKNGKIAVYKGVKSFSGNTVTFSDEKIAQFDAVILATGYRPNFNFLSTNTYFSGGLRDQIPAVTGEQPGLYFCGFRNPPTGALRGIGIDARKIADHIYKNKRKQA